MDMKMEAKRNRYIQYMYSYPHKTAYRLLENVNLRDYFFNLEGEGHSLYLHLPFCESKCGYCNLFSVTGCSQIQMDEYIDAVVRQIRQYKEILPRGASFGDFTIGGGTPLLLSGEQITRVFEAVSKDMPMSAGHKIIIETAPNQTDKKKVALLKKLGVTRVSMGIQSFDNGELRWLGRNHDSERAKEAAEILADMAFECVNFDFIYGLPGQTADSLLCSLRTALSYSPDEIFLYPLYIKHGVWLEREGRQELLDSDHTYALYQCGSEYLRENGYDQISMRRFVRKDSASRTLEEAGSRFMESGSVDCTLEEKAGSRFMESDSASRTLEEEAGSRFMESGSADCTLEVATGHFPKKGSVSQFAKEDNACDFRRENTGNRMPVFNECGFKSALSLGCGGRSYLGRLHTCTPYRISRNAALEEIERFQRTEDFSFVTNGILLSDDEIRRRYVIRHLLILPGISRQAYKKAFQSHILEDFPIIRKWLECGWLEERHSDVKVMDINNMDTDVADAVSHDYIVLTREGLGLSDFIGPQLISEDIRKKMLEWERENA